MDLGFYQLAAAAAVLGLFLVAAVYKVAHDGSAKSATAYTGFGFFAAVTTALITAVPEALKVTREFPELFGGAPVVQAAAPPSQSKSVERVEKTIIIERVVAAPPAAPAPPVSESGSMPASATLAPTVAPAAKHADVPAKAEKKPVAKADGAAPAKFAVAALTPAPATKPQPPQAAEPPSDDRLASQIKLELQRLNCFKGPADGVWGKDAVKAVHYFNVYGYRRVADTPEEETLTILKGFEKPVCP